MRTAPINRTKRRFIQLEVMEVFKFVAVAVSQPERCELQGRCLALQASRADDNK